MAFLERVHVGDVGTVFLLTVYDTTSSGTPQTADISSATTKQMRLQDPAGISTTKEASFTTDGTDGKMEYASVSGDILTAGRWHIQGFVILTDGEWNTSTECFDVYENL